MKVAVTYDNGNVFQHFGHSEQFKVYEVEDNKIVSSEVIGTDGAGHEALATLLDSKSIDTLICGGIGGGAMEALNANGIQVFSGVSGDCDEAVECLINGELFQEESTVITTTMTMKKKDVTVEITKADAHAQVDAVAECLRCRLSMRELTLVRQLPLTMREHLTMEQYLTHLTIEASHFSSYVEWE